MARKPIIAAIVVVLAGTALFWKSGSPAVAAASQAVAPAAAQSGPPVCVSEYRDLTSDSVKAILEEARELIPMSSVEFERSAPGKQKSKQLYLVISPDGSRHQVTVSCDYDCGGQSCATAGCVASGGRCTPFSCIGEGCNGTCTKVSTQ